MPRYTDIDEGFEHSARGHGSTRYLDDEYDSFLGAPKRRVYYDPVRRKWYECVVREPRTRQDFITRSRTETDLSPEPWERDKPGPKHPSRRYAIKPSTIDALVAIRKALESGPLRISPLAAACALTIRQTQEILQRHGSRYGIGKATSKTYCLIGGG